MASDPLASHVAEMHQFDDDVEEALFGPWRPDVLGETRDETKGLVHRVGQLWADSQSGGLRTRLSKTDRSALLSIILLVGADVASRVFH